MVKHLGKENQAPQANSVLSAGSPVRLCYNQNPSPAAAKASDETSENWDWKSRKQDLIQSITAA